MGREENYQILGPVKQSFSLGEGEKPNLQLNGEFSTNRKRPICCGSSGESIDSSL